MLRQAIASSKKWLRRIKLSVRCKSKGKITDVVKQAVCRFFQRKCFRQFCFAANKNCRTYSFGIEKWNVGNHLKRVVQKIVAKRSHSRVVNGCSKFCNVSDHFSYIGVEKWSEGHRLERVFPKFEAKRCHPRRADGRSKFWTRIETVNFQVAVRN